ncbi:MAG: DoxX-like family protein [Halopseudomonas sp.]|uniref:DoxX-like family protein n=1 Tax=Halopseudomonas sp. TaxID=2901191 RepID=UPI003003536F
MAVDNLRHISFCCRVGLGLLFVYHGLVPKILYLSAIEVSLVEASGAGLPARIASPLAGVVEILLGVLIALRLGGKVPVWLAALALLGLLLYVAVLSPALLVEAFNPVTTNLLGLLLCYLILRLESSPGSVGAG